MVSLLPGADVEKVTEPISGWGDVSVFTATGQRELLLKGSVEKVRRQIGLLESLDLASRTLWANSCFRSSPGA